MQDAEQYKGAPVHYFSAALVMLLDWMWTPAEGGFTLSGIGIMALPLAMLLLAVVAFSGVFLVQKFLAHDAIGASVAKAFVMAVVAAVPFPVAGTVVGMGLLGTSGINALRGKS